MTASTRILAVVPLQSCRQVRMAGTGHGLELAVVLRLGVGVLKDDGQRSSRGVSLIDSADNPGSVFLLARGRTLHSALAAEDVIFEVLHGQFKAGRHSVQHHANQFSMRLTENRDSEFSSEGIHISIYVLSSCKQIAIYPETAGRTWPRSLHHLW